jgi:hypothetical protein
MKHFACLCGFRTEGAEPNVCAECGDDMYGYVPPPFKPIGRVIRPIVADVVAKAKKRGRR